MALKVFNKGEGGRPKGAKNRLSWSFLNALADDFEAHGIETIRICRVERPNEYLKIVAGLMPRELEITETNLWKSATMSLPLTSSLPVADLPADESLLLAALEAEKNRRLTENRLQYYKPYPKQAEFHAAGAKYRERLLMAGNQTGKTLASAMELAMHVTGQYPDWWQGHRFDRAIRAWCCGETSEVVRETLQLLLLGPDGAARNRVHSESISGRGGAGARSCRPDRHHPSSARERRYQHHRPQGLQPGP